MKNTIFLLLACLCFACNSNNTNTADTIPESTDSKAASNNEKIVIAQYESAAVYPAHIEYQFIDEEGNSILVKKDTYDYASDPDMEKPEDAIELGVPPRMLGDRRLLGEDEAFPSTNPALIGQSFKLYYNATNEVYKIEKEKEISITRMTYRSAADYPMHTLYEFSATNGGSILVNVSKEEGAKFTEIPDNLLEEDEDLEGLPGENPELVGKAFDLHFDKENRVVKVELVEI